MSATAPQSRHAGTSMPSSPSSKIVAPGMASRIGECVAMMNCAPPSASSWICASSAICRIGDSPDSGSSSRYSPSANRCVTIAHTDSPCDRWCSLSGP